MKAIFISIVLLCSAATGFGQYTSKLDQRASVVFPSKPKEMMQSGQPIQYTTLDRDNKVTAMATAIDATQYGVDSAMIVQNYNNTLFVDLILQSITGQYEGMRLVSKKKIAIGKLMGYDVVLVNDAPSTDVPYQHVYAQVYFYGAKVYAMTVLSELKEEVVKERDKFFQSLKVD